MQNNIEPRSIINSPDYCLIAFLLSSEYINTIETVNGVITWDTILK